VSQPTLDGMPEPLYPATPARLGTYLDCPRRYRMAYLDRPTPPKGPPWGHNSVGAAVHNALARWWDLPRDRRTPQAGGALLVSGSARRSSATWRTWTPTTCRWGSSARSR
jgi:hypothetical protein